MNAAPKSSWIATDRGFAPATTTWCWYPAAAALALAYLYLSFLPNQRAMKRLSAELDAKQQYVDEASSINVAVKIAGGELERTQAYNAAWTSLVPPRAELAALLGKLDALVVASGARPARFDPSPAVPMEKLCRVPVVVGCTGTFSQIAKFLVDLESLPQMAWIDRLKMEPRGQDGENVETEFDMTIFTDNPNDSRQVDLAG